MRTATLPFKHRDTDREWLVAKVLIPDTLWDRLRLRFGRYRVGTSVLFGSLYYDPASIRREPGVLDPYV